MKERRRDQIFITAFLLVAIAVPGWSLALTTFGKSNPQNQNQNPPPPPTQIGKARECKVDSDCAGIQYTLCLSDRRDGKLRCLCGDYSPPENGACPTRLKGTKVQCSEDSECTEGAHCVNGNNTLSGKRCYCMEGYEEESNLCNGSPAMIGFSVVSLIAGLLLIGSV